MKEHRKAAAASKGKKLASLALKRVIPFMRSGPPSSEINTTDEPTGIPPSVTSPAFKNGGKVVGSMKAARADRPVSKERRAIGGGVDADSKGEEMAKRTAAAATLTGQSNRLGYKAGGAAKKADGGEVEEKGVSGPDKNGMATYKGRMSLMDAQKDKGQGQRAGFKDGGAVSSKKKGGTTVNVIIAPQGGGAGPGSGPPLVPPGGLAMPPPGALPPRPPMPPPAGPAAMPPGLPPGGPSAMPPGGVMPLRANGGRVGGKPDVDYDAGAGGAKGRLEKARKYGDNAKVKTLGNN